MKFEMDNDDAFKQKDLMKQRIWDAAKLKGKGRKTQAAEDFEWSALTRESGWQCIRSYASA